MQKRASVFLLSCLLFCSQFLFAQEQEKDPLEKYYFRSEMVGGSVAIASGFSFLIYSLKAENTFVPQARTGAVAGLLLGAVVLGIGIDDCIDYKKSHKIQTIATTNSIGVRFSF